MKLYLSSYRLGDNTDEFIRLVDKPNAKVAVITNATDCYSDEKIKSEKLEQEMQDMKSLGFMPEHIDLRDYFGNNEALFEIIKTFDAVWVRGGNAFILIKAFRQSGFDKVVNELIKTNRLVYAGYSAALCAISPSLDGVELVDDKDAKAEGYDDEIIWEGYGLIDFYPIVHYKSDHPESELIEKELEHIKSKNIKYRTLRDGETVIVDN
jgi:dipeptidase E